MSKLPGKFGDLVEGNRIVSVDLGDVPAGHEVDLGDVTMLPG